MTATLQVYLSVHDEFAQFLSLFRTAVAIVLVFALSLFFHMKFRIKPSSINKPVDILFEFLFHLQIRRSLTFLYCWAFLGMNTIILFFHQIYSYIFQQPYLVKISKVRTILAIGDLLTEWYWGCSGQTGHDWGVFSSTPCHFQWQCGPHSILVSQWD